MHIFQVSQHRFAFGNFRRCDVTSRVKARFSLANMFVLVKKLDFHCVRHYCLIHYVANANIEIYIGPDFLEVTSPCSGVSANLHTRDMFF